MGTCMSKDKKGATVHTTRASALSSSSQHKYPSQEGAASLAKSAENLPSNIVRPSSGEEASRESISRDKHVVEIRLPIASPNKFKESPTSATLAARAMAAIARSPKDERFTEEAASEDSFDLEEEADGEAEAASNARNSSLPLLYSSYLSGASFSRDLAAFSRDIASLSCSPLKKSPSVNGAHDFIAAAIKAAHMSPHYIGHDKPLYAGMEHEDCSTNTRSRSLPKRFYGKGGHNAYHSAAPPSALLHKRSSSRDAVCINSVALSPRIAVRREEASGEFRVCARQAAVRRSSVPAFTHHHQVAAAAVPISSRAKERSPSNRRSCSTSKIATDATDYTTTLNALHFQENQTTSSMQPAHAFDKSRGRGRQALKDRSTNCAAWVDTNSYGLESSFKDLKNTVAEPNVKEDSRGNCGGINENNEIFHRGLHGEATRFERPNSPVRYAEKPCLADHDQSDDFCMDAASMHRVESWIKALTDMRVENSLLSEVEDSETEVEGELDLIRFAFDARLSPRKELRAQKARNLLLKEAAKDAFARPSFDSNNKHPVGLHEGKQAAPDLTALMPMRLPDAETRTSKIRKVLQLLSAAESEMGNEQKTLFYNQLQMVLDSVKSQTFSTESSPRGGAKFMPNMATKSVAFRANSWPRVMKEPVHIITSGESNLTDAVNKTVNHDSSMKILEPSQSHGFLPESMADQEKEERCLAELCKILSEAREFEGSQCKVMGDTLQISENDSISLGLDAGSRHGSKVFHANEKGDLSHEADKFPMVDISPQQELIKEVQWSVETVKAPAMAVLNGDNAYFASGFQHETSQVTTTDAEVAETSLITTSVEVAASISLERKETEDFTGAAEGALMEEKNLSACTEVPCEEHGSEGKEILDLPQPSLDMCVADTKEGVHGDSQQTLLLHCREVLCTDGTFLREGGGGCCRSDDGGSNGSFEFRVRSTVSTPLSTPSTPMLSTASTPRHTSHVDPPLTAQALVEIWEAFD